MKLTNFKKLKLTVLKNIHFSTKIHLILLMSAFSFQKNSIFVKNSSFAQSKSMRAVLEMFEFSFPYF